MVSRKPRQGLGGELCSHVTRARPARSPRRRTAPSRRRPQSPIPVPRRKEHGAPADEEPHQQRARAAHGHADDGHSATAPAIRHPAAHALPSEPTPITANDAIAAGRMSPP